MDIWSRGTGNTISINAARFEVDMSDPFTSLWFVDEGQETDTSREQIACEKSCAKLLYPFTTAYQHEETLAKCRDIGFTNSENEVCLLREKHVKYLMSALVNGLPSGFVVLDASQPWLLYWIFQALYLLDRSPTELYEKLISSLNTMKYPSGGYGGGPKQLPHCAPTYASVLALCSTGTVEAFQSIDRAGIYNFFLSVHDKESGGFCMHDEGEIDARGTYCVLSIARLLNILTPELVEGAADFLLSCQSYEGGFGGEPFNEAHGGYNFCAVAGLIILGEAHRLDLNGLRRWLFCRQLPLEGGFSGRTNKLVDSCYSFWQGAAAALVNVIEVNGTDVSDLEYWKSSMGGGTTSAKDNSTKEADEDVPKMVKIDETSENGPVIYNQYALQRYILHCAQAMEGGMRDKPGKYRDFYHSCYSLSGLSIAQNFVMPGSKVKGADNALPRVYGDAGNLLPPTSAIFNIGLDPLEKTLAYFSKLSCSHELFAPTVELDE